MKDRFGRTVNYLRVSVTERCNLRCVYCAPEAGTGEDGRGDRLSADEMRVVIEAALGLGVEKVRLTGGEPLARKDIISIVASVGGDPRLKDFALTTNGILLAEAAADLKRAGLSRVNISLDTLDAEKYKRLTRGGRLADALAGLERARAVGLAPIKVNAVLIGGVNDGEMRELSRLVTEGLADELRFIELMPFGETAGWPAERFVRNDIVRQTLCLTAAANDDPSSTALLYNMPNGGRVGLIDPLSHKFCRRCNRMRLTADGCLKPCLLCDDEIDVKPSLRGGQGSVTALLNQAVAAKPEQHKLGCGVTPQKRNMVRVGG